MGYALVPDALPMQEFRRLDLNSEEMGVPVRRLMDNAGKALAAEAQRRAKGGHVLLLCGKGNNGGDGYAASFHLLRAGVAATCIQLEPPTGPESREAMGRLPDGAVTAWKKFAVAKRRPKVDLVVDCLLGSGILDEPRAPYDQAIRWMNRQPAPVLACDVPSGFGSRLAVKPTATLTFHAKKQGMTKATCGIVTVVPIGIPARAATDIGVGDLKVGYPRPAPDDHKGDGGRVLIVGGGPFTGAPHYAGMAAARTGADLVHVWAPADAAAVIRAWGPTLLVHETGPGEHLNLEDARRVAQHFGDADALLLGPGLGRHPETLDAARWLLADAAKVGLPVVVDADGLDAVSEKFLREHGNRTVLTPHGREFEDLAGRTGTPAVVHAYAAKHGVTVLRKGVVDVVSDGTRRRMCRRGHVTMTAGGTGDVLAGVTAALLARQASPFDAACAAAYLVGVAGEIAANTFHLGATATDVHEAIPAVLHRLDD